MTNSLIEKLEGPLFANESLLTTNVMRRLIFDLSLSDPDLIFTIYETVHFFTDGAEEFGSSDYGAVLRSMRDRHISYLQHKEKEAPSGA